jgi:hypothetical protein
VSSDHAAGASLNLPVFSAWLVMECGDVRKVISAAQELRADERVRLVREQLREVRNGLEAGDLTTANQRSQRLITQIEKSSSRLVSEFGLKSASGISTGRLLMVYNTLASMSGLPKLPQIDLTFKLPAPLERALPKRGISALYRDIGHDLAGVWALGEARDKLGAAVRLHKDGTHAYIPKAEQERFRNYHTEFKSPM